MTIELDQAYAGRVDTTDPDYPWGKGRNIQDGVPNTGTPFDEKWFNDFEGNKQALLRIAGIVPSGVSDSAVNSDQFEAMKRVQRGFLVGNPVGSFRYGFEFTSANDVGIDNDGNFWKYSGAGSYPITVAADTDPTSGDFTQAYARDGQINPVGNFADGVTFNFPNDAARDAVGEYWVWTGVLPYIATAGTVPSSGDYEKVFYNSASEVSNENGGSVQDFIDLVYPVTSFDVLDLNFLQPFRNESDYNISMIGVLQTGQSLAEGGVGGGVVAGVSSVAFPDRTLMLINGPIGLNNGIIGPSYTGLIENSRVTTGHSITKTLATGNADKFIFSGQAWGGKNYNDLKKGGSTGVYEKCITQVSNINSQVDSLTYEYVTCIHGEQDGLDNNTSYALNLNEWATDFNSDIKAITGQVEDVNMLICQTSTAGGYGFNGGIDELTFPTPIQQLLAHETYLNVTLVCPKYFLDYADHAHITNYSQRVLGEYYARAMKTTSYEPLSPSSFNIVGSGVVVTFKGNEGQLVDDNVNVNAIANSGFSYRDDSGNTITSVVISGVNEITVNLNGSPSSNAVLAYAYHNGAGGRQNQIDGNGDRGNIRDSSTDVSIYGDGYNLYNWLVTFRQELN